MFFVLSTAWDKEKILSPHEESNPRPLNSEGLGFDCSWGLRIFLCPMLLTKQKTSFFKNYIVHLCFDHQKKCYVFTEKRLDVDIISIIFHNHLSMNPC